MDLGETLATSFDDSFDYASECFELMFSHVYSGCIGIQPISILNSMGQRDTPFISMHEDYLFGYHEP